MVGTPVERHGRRGGAARRIEGPILALLAAGAFVLGFFGFSEAFKASGESRPFLDLLYLTLQLFALESGAAVRAGNWMLDTARFLAPSVAAYAAIKAVLSLFRDRLSAWRLPFLRRHSLVCGRSPLSAHLVRNLVERGGRVAALADNAAEAARLGRLGAIPVVGEGRDPDVLKKAGLRRASQVIAVYDQDGLNAETAVRAFLLAEKRRGPALRVFAHIIDPALCNSLRERAFRAEKADAAELEFFNVYDAGVRALLDETNPFALRTSGSAPVIAVLGLGTFGQSLLWHLARRWKAAGGSPTLDVIAHDPQAVRVRDSLDALFPRFRDVCRILPVVPRAEASPVPPQAADDLKAADVVYICFDDEALSLRTALDLAQRGGLNAREIVVRTNGESGLSALLASDPAGGSASPRLRAFPLFERACRPEIVCGGMHETVARALHQAYSRHRDETGLPAGEGALPWEGLSPRLRESNRSQARDIGPKLAAIGCGLAFLSDWEADGFAFSPSEIETLSELEHERWMTDHLAEGWRFAPGPKDPRRKTHPDLVPWADLPEPVRELDRIFIRDLPRILAGVDLQIVRRGG